MLAESHSAAPSRALRAPVMRLLIIEDDRDASAYIVKAFRELGHVTDSAENGLDGYALASEGDYDVLIVDRMLPKLDGLSVIRSLREQGIATPVLILSALGQVDDRVKGLRAGGDDLSAEALCLLRTLARTEAWPVGAARPALRKRDIGSAISNWTGCHTGSAAAVRRSRFNRANSACSNI